jgi:lipopolysaccharide transport system permease protein
VGPRFVTSATPDSLAAERSMTQREDAPTLDAPDAVELVDHRPSLLETLRESWRCRYLLWDISATALMAVLSKYRLGPFWIIFQTVMGVIGWSLIGGKVANFHAPNGMPYWLYTMVGIMGWTLFQSTLVISARSFMRLKTLVKEVYFPLILVPIAGSAQALLRFFLLFVVYVIAVIYYWLAKGHLYFQLAPKYIFYSAAGLFLCATLAWGISLWTAPLTMHTRDVRMLIRYVTPFLFFVTPVLYPIDHLHGKTRLVAELNPLSSPVEMTKVGLLGAGSVRLYAAIWGTCAIALVFASGVWFMNRFGVRVVGLGAGDDDDDEDEFL